MSFKKYQHLERYGKEEVANIEIGKCYIFPKIDGTNANVWFENNQIKAGSRNKELTLESDNAGFFKYISEQENILNYLKENPTHRLFGEWLVPHSLKTYRDDTWKKFYIFDVAIDCVNDDINQEEKQYKYLTFDEYQPLLEKHNLNVIYPILVTENPNYDTLLSCLNKNTYLIEDGKGNGEGIVIKNYDFKNKYGRTVWAKIVTNEFKEKHTKVMRNGVVNESKQLVEEKIVNKYITKAFCDKEYAKIMLNTVIDTTDRKALGKLNFQVLSTIYYELIREESWNFIKEHKNPTINFNMLQALVFAKVKVHLSELF